MDQALIPISTIQKFRALVDFDSRRVVPGYDSRTCYGVGDLLQMDDQQDEYKRMIIKEWI